MNGAYLDAPELFRRNGTISLAFEARGSTRPPRERALANAYEFIQKLRAAGETVEAQWSESNAEQLLAWWEPCIAEAQIVRDDLLAVVPVAREGDERVIETDFPRTLNSLRYFCGELEDVAMLVSGMQSDNRRRLFPTARELIAKLQRFDRDAALTFAMRGLTLQMPAISLEAFGVSVSFRDRAEPRLTLRKAMGNARDVVASIRKANGAFLPREEMCAGIEEYEIAQPAIERLCEDASVWWDARLASARIVLADLLAYLPFEPLKRLDVLSDRPMARTCSFSELCIELERLMILVQRTS
jgi:hypothetical protein